MRKFVADFLGMSCFLVALSGIFIFAEALGHIAH